MSHELRTPLTAVIGFAQMMAHNPIASVREKKNLDIILRSGEHLLSLINDVLDFSKIEAGRIDQDLRDVDLCELFCDVTSMMRDRAERKGLQLIVNQTPAFPRFANTDAGKLRQVIINLVANAIKFTTAGRITIDLDARLVQDGYLLTIDITDTGIGISKDKRDLIFLPFVQAKSRLLEEGTGLGLAISRQYVEILGGVITVDSELNQGSRFRIAIPAGLANVDSVQALEEHPRRIGIESPTSDIRILIVEDQQENLQLINSLLSHFGFQIREAVNGQEAVAAFQEWQPHLILMDRRMPVLDGIAATRQIRALPGGGNPVIIAVSAQTFKNDQQEMLGAGSNGFLSKPFSIDEMLKMLGDQLKLKLRHAEPPAKARSLTPADLRPVPVPVLRNLHDLIIEGQHDDLLAWVDGQTVLDAEAKRAMKHHLDNYQFEFLAKIIEPLIMKATSAGISE
jgi:CheY-like chemotaxis protein